MTWDRWLLILEDDEAQNGPAIKYQWVNTPLGREQGSIRVQDIIGDGAAPRLEEDLSDRARHALPRMLDFVGEGHARELRRRSRDARVEVCVQATGPRSRALPLDAFDAENVVVTRDVPVAREDRSAPVHAIRRVAIVGASPPRQERISGLTEFIDSLAEELQSIEVGGRKLDVAPNAAASCAALADAAAGADIVILVCHGEAGTNLGEGIGVWLESEDSDGYLCPPAELGALMPDARLVLMVSCHGGESTPGLLDLSIAEAVAEQGVDALLAFDGPVRWASARPLLSELIGTLFASGSLNDAVRGLRRRPDDPFLTRTRLRVYARQAAGDRLFSAGYTTNSGLEADASFRSKLASVSRGVADGASNPLVPRTRLREAVEDWLRSGSNQVLVIEGGPGVGKSAFMIDLATRRPASVQIVCGWFHRRDDQKQVREVVRALATQLSAALPQHADRFGRFEEGSDALTGKEIRSGLVDPLRNLADEGVLVGEILVVIDGLDEAQDGPLRPFFTVVPDHAGLVALLAESEAPLKLVATTRPEDPFEGSHSIVVGGEGEDLEDVAEWIRRELDTHVPVWRDRRRSLPEEIIDKSHGNFLVAGSIIRGVCELADLDLVDPEAFPENVDAAMRDEIRRITSLQETYIEAERARVRDEVGNATRREAELERLRFSPIEVVVFTSLGQEGGVSPLVLSRCLFGSQADAGWLRHLRCLSPWIGTDDAGNYVPYHQYLFEHVRARQQPNSGDRISGTALTTEDANAVFVDLIHELDNRWEDADDYFIRASGWHLAEHLRYRSLDDERAVARFARMCIDRDWLVRRIFHHGATRCLEDLNRAMLCGITELTVPDEDE